ncbi:acyltransferase family protein [Xanthobacter variabilis]|uniref:acyltransferase family protein n=1 Tax=Xanthobacter variabilis TaxID=3119932 RepID=UPI00374F354A
MRYRADISGLRALAVLPVVLFHAGFTAVPGGFVGVDVFFVISGYLITTIIASDLDKEGFSLTRFYDRRVRRILPAYVLVAVVTTVAALIILPPAVLARYGEQLRAASVFFANDYFRSKVFYFGPDAHEQPLLHMWSLSIEEQFYLFWPLLLAAFTHPRLKRLRPYLIFGLMAFSLYDSTRNAILEPNRAYFNLSGRIWELLLGATLALGLLPRIRRPIIAELLAAAGVLMILGASAFFTRQTTFPGAMALIPTLGALFILWAGEQGRVTWAGRLLSITPLVWVGLISYSLYLWHWPILVFLWLVTGREPSTLMLVAAIAVMLLCSFLSWRFVEAPFRRSAFSSFRSEMRSIGIGVCALLILIGVGSILKWTHGLPSRSSAVAEEVERQTKTLWKGTDACLLGSNGRDVPVSDETCRFGSTDPHAPLMALWGDSFANHHAPAVDDVARDLGFGLVQMTRSGCFSRLPDDKARTRDEKVCNAFRERSLKAIFDNPEIKLVVLGGNWRAAHDPEETLASLAAAVKEFTATGRAVVLIAPPVAFMTGGGRCVIQQSFLGNSPEHCGIDAKKWAQHVIPTEQALARMAEGNPLVRVVIPREHFCDGDQCSPVLNGKVVMADGGHLNVAGSMVLRDDIDKAVESLLPAIKSH